nr:AraC family transcriptional regulator [Micromonospora rosaria]
MDPPGGIDTPALSDLAPTPDWRRPVLVDSDLLVLVTDGYGTVELDFRALPCRPGTLLRIRPGQAVRCGGERPFDALLLRWRADTLAGTPAADDVTPEHCHLRGDEGAAVRDGIHRLAADRQRYRDEPAAADLLRHQLAVLLLRLALFPTGQENPPRGERATFQRLCQEVERGYRHTRRVEDYAAQLGCSVRTLTRACLAVTGRSAKQVIDERVALEAARLLAATDEPIAQIGRRLGFPEPTNFGRFFTREVGRSPGAFRASRDQRAPAPDGRAANPDGGAGFDDRRAATGNGRPPGAGDRSRGGRPSDGPQPASDMAQRGSAEAQRPPGSASRPAGIVRPRQPTERSGEPDRA